MRFLRFVLLISVYFSSLAGAAPTNPNNSLILRVHDGAIELPSSENELPYPCSYAKDKALSQVFEKYGVYSITRELSDIPKFKNVNGRLVKRPDFSNIFVLDIRDENQVDECKKELDELGCVDYAALNKLDAQYCYPDDPYYLNGDQWWLHEVPYPSDIINVHPAWAFVDSIGCFETPRVGIIDSGVLSSHPDLSFSGESATTINHGTRVCGVLAAITNNGTGVAGVTNNQVEVNSYRWLAGTDSVIDLVNKIVSAADYCNVVSISIGWYYYDVTLRNAILYCYKSGVPFVAAAGNSTSARYPGRHLETVFGVGGIDQSSNPVFLPGAAIDVSAPAISIRTTSFDESLNPTYELASGTSFATPMVSATFGLLNCLNTCLNNSSCLMPEDYEWLTKTTAADIVPVGPDTLSGWGRLDVGRAVGNMYGSYRVFMDEVEGATLVDTSPLVRVRLAGFEPDYSSSVLYQVQRLTFERYVDWSADVEYADSVWSWGRQGGSTGISGFERRYYHMDFTADRIVENSNMCYPVPESMSLSGATFRSYAYILYSMANPPAVLDTIGVINPQQISFAFGVTGKLAEDKSGSFVRSLSVQLSRSIEIVPNWGKGPFILRCTDKSGSPGMIVGARTPGCIV